MVKKVTQMVLSKDILDKKSELSIKYPHINITYRYLVEIGLKSLEDRLVTSPQ